MSQQKAKTRELKLTLDNGTYNLLQVLSKRSGLPVSMVINRIVSLQFELMEGAAREMKGMKSKMGEA